MPEGPSIVLLREAASVFVGKQVVRATGNAKIDIARIKGHRIVAIHSWGKHLLIEFDAFSVRIHLLMFGSFLINDRKPATPRLSLKFKQGELNFYSCSVRFIDTPLSEVYDWRADVMSEQWDDKLARSKLLHLPKTLACDALLDQTIFSGVGNIIKNEVLFRIRLHPLSEIGALSSRKLNELIKQARLYSFEFLEWKRAFVLRKHWLAHTKSICPRCHIPFLKGKLGKTQRRSFYCKRCQIKYIK